MARQFLASSSQYLAAASVPVTVEPLTMACWFNPDDITTENALMCLNNGGGNGGFVLTAAGNAASDPIQALKQTTGAATGTASKTGFIANTWQHAAAVFSSTTSRTAYLNGVAGTANVTSLGSAGVTETKIGARELNGVISRYTSGDIAEAAIWDIALTADELLRLSLGFSPLCVRPESLVFYAPLIGRYSPEIDIIGGINLSRINAPSTIGHPRIFNTFNSSYVPVFPAALIGVDADFLMNWESQLSVYRDNSVSVEHNLKLNLDNILNTEELLQMSAEDTINTENLESTLVALDVDGLINTESLLALDTDGVINTESLVNLNTDKVINTESLVALDIDKVINTEHLLHVYSQQCSLDDLTHYWNFDDNADDIIGGDIFDFVSAPYDNTYVKNGTASGYSYLQASETDIGDLEPLTGNSFSYSMWFYMIGANLSGSTYLVHSVDGPDGPITSLHTYIELNGDLTTYSLITKAFSGSGTSTISTLGDISINAWHHLVLEYDANTGIIYQYLDGALLASGDILASGGFPVFGAGQRYVYFGDSSSGYEAVKVDEIGFWPRTLSLGEISALYNGDSGRFYPSLCAPVDTLHNEGLLGVNIDGPVNDEGSLSINLDSVTNNENILSITKDDSVADENILGLSNDGPLNDEALLTANIDQSAHTEHSLLLNQNGTINDEYNLQLSQDAILDSEGLLALDTDGVVNVEHLGAQLVDLNVDGEIPIEHLLQVHHDSIINNEVILSVNVDATANLENCLVIYLDGDTNVESLIQLASDHNVALEQLLLLSRDFETNTESVLSLSSNGETNVEWTNIIDTDTPCNTEHLGLIILDKEVNTEFLAQVFQNHSTENEHLLQISSDAVLQVYNISELIVDGNIQTEYAGAILAEASTCLEYLLSVSQTDSATYEHLLSLSSDALVNVENLGTEEVIAGFYEFLLTSRNKVWVLRSREKNLRLPTRYVIYNFNNDRDSVYSLRSRNRTWTL